jgi:CRISPR-associated protein (TIGR03986 family)
MIAMVVSAPFRFAPIHRWVYFPEWGPLVTHDVPFKDGWSGEIELAITAVTPLLVGGARRTPAEAREGEVWPVQLPGGRWAIPPSALQGMVRSILEIATFAQLGPWIDDRRFGIRDLTRPAMPYYQKRLNDISGSNPIRVDPRVKTGWLRRRDDGAFELKRCEFARIEYSDLEQLTGVKPQRWKGKSNADERYSWVRPAARLRQRLEVQRAEPKPRHPHGNRSLSIAYRKVTGPTGTTTGKIVLTGNPSDPPTKPGRSSKHLEFFFFDEKPPIELKQFDERWEEFKSIHEPDDGRPVNPNWKFFRDEGYPDEEERVPFKNGGWMPIFFLADGNGGIESFGLAFMFKLAHEQRTLDLVSNSSPRHLTCEQRKARGFSDGVQDGAEDGADLPSLIFGSVADGQGGGLKRRAAFDVAFATLPPGKGLENWEPTVLLGPKPSYFPIYVRQADSSERSQLRVESETKDGKLVYAPYATYTSLNSERYPNDRFRKPEHEQPELAGVKIWPVKNLHFARLPEEVQNNRKVQTRLRALPKGTRFEGTKLRVHNLRPVELGALVWALTFGDTAALHGEDSGKRHRVGMGKPYGLGQISICITDADLSPNDPRPPVPAQDLKAANQKVLDDALKAFEEHMTTVYRDSGDHGAWEGSVQVQSLIKAAKPQPGERLDYMPLQDRRNRDNADTYVGARANGWFLPRYAEGGEAPRGGAADDNPANRGSSRRAAPPPPTPALKPRVGARVRMTSGVEGEIIEELPNEPRWLVKLDGGNRPVRYKQNLFTVIG